MNNEALVYIAPVILFLGGAGVIYLIYRYYLKRMTDFWGTDKGKDHRIEFNFRSTEAWWVLALLTLSVAIALALFHMSATQQKHDQSIERDALEQYKENIEDDVKREILEELKPLQ